jgi:uncharacterized protein YndB with AHSA1/START domain
MTTVEQEVETLRITKTESIAAPADVVWEALLHQLGPDAEFEPGKRMNFTLEPFPGGRWYRDLGDGVGHFWGHVQVIKPNKVLELCGPMFMSYAATSHVQYKLVPDGATTTLELVHTAFGLIPPDVAAGLQGGWGEQMKLVRQRAERRGR